MLGPFSFFHFFGCFTLVTMSFFIQENTAEYKLISTCLMADFLSDVQKNKQFEDIGWLGSLILAILDNFFPFFFYI